jgi:hypothetical protein
MLRQKEVSIIIKEALTKETEEDLEKVVDDQNLEGGEEAQ